MPLKGAFRLRVKCQMSFLVNKTRRFQRTGKNNLTTTVDSTRERDVVVHTYVQKYIRIEYLKNDQNGLLKYAH